MRRAPKTDKQRDYRQFRPQPGDLYVVRECQYVYVDHSLVGPGTLLLVLSGPHEFGWYVVSVVGTNKVGRCEWHSLTCKQTTKLVNNLGKGRVRTESERRDT